MRDSSRKLNTEPTVWRQCADTASREEDGWESDAPNWNDLVKDAQELLVESNLLSGGTISIGDRDLSFGGE